MTNRKKRKPNPTFPQPFYKWTSSTLMLFSEQEPYHSLVFYLVASLFISFANALKVRPPLPTSRPIPTPNSSILFLVELAVFTKSRLRYMYAKVSFTFYSHAYSGSSAWFLQNRCHCHGQVSSLIPIYILSVYCWATKSALFQYLQCPFKCSLPCP